MSITLAHIRTLVKSLVACTLVASCFVFTACSQQTYTPQLRAAELTPPVIKQDGTLRVGVNASKSPLAGKGSNGIIGIDVDIAAALSNQLGLKLDIVDVGADGEKALEEGKVDVIMGQEKVEDSSTVWHSEQYMPTGVVLFGKEGTPAGVPNTTVTPKIAAQVSSKSAWAVTNAFGDTALSSTTDLASAFADLQKGSVDYVASDAVIGMYAAHMQNVPVSILCLLDTASGYCVGVSPANTELQTAINEALKAVEENGIIALIEDKWLGGKIDLSNLPKADTKVKTSDANAPATSNTTNTADPTHNAGGGNTSKPPTTLA